MEREKRGFFFFFFCRDEVSGWLLSSAEKLSLQRMFVQSECVCVRVCVFVLEWVCFSGVLTEALHRKSSLPFGKTSLQRKREEKNP